MKKVLILLIIITLGLIGYDAYEYFNMQKEIEAYKQDQKTYLELVEEEGKNQKEIDELKNQLENRKTNNLENNKEYQIWMNLNKTVNKLVE